MVFFSRVASSAYFSVFVEGLAFIAALSVSA